MAKVIIHNAITLDGSIRGFDLDMGQYYGIAINYKADAALVGSATVKLANDKIPKETKEDFKRHTISKGDTRPYWVVVDTKGILKGVLHSYRRMEYIKDIIVLVSKKTPKSYIKYLEERNYIIITTGNERADFKRAISLLEKNYGFKRFITDSGGVLNNVLLDEGLVDEISIMIYPSIF